MLAMAGQDVDAYLKEMEEVHRQTQAEKAARFQSRMDALSHQTKKPQQLQEGPARRYPGMPPMPRPLLGGGLRNAAPATPVGVVSAAPQLIPKESTPVSANATATSNAPVIESKPQIRNLLSDVTR